MASNNRSKKAQNVSQQMQITKFLDTLTVRIMSTDCIVYDHITVLIDSRDKCFQPWIVYSQVAASMTLTDLALAEYEMTARNFSGNLPTTHNLSYSKIVQSSWLVITRAVRIPKFWMWSEFEYWSMRANKLQYFSNVCALFLEYF